MQRRRILTLAACALLVSQRPALAQAQPDPLVRLDAEQWRAVQQFVTTKNGAPAGGRASTDVFGQSERMAIEGREIRIRTLMPAKNDPRCCPTLKKVHRIRWQGGRLVSSGV